ncbi:MAG: FecR domain-containing protein [Pirellulales bacterium]|nr:FecR domain-containing protein [Pirellulales bacterium]
MNERPEAFDRDMPENEKRHNELYALAAGYADGQLSREETQRLESLLVDHPALCDRFLDYMQMISALESEPTRLRESLAQSTELPDGEAAAARSNDGAGSANAAATEGSPVLGFLADCFKQGIGFFSRSYVFSLLVAIGFPALVLFVLVLGVVWQAPSKASVATITQTSDCVAHVDDARTAVFAGMKLAAGQEITLENGLIEIAFADGARAVLEAPTTFQIRDGNAGFLQMGRLAADVPKSAHGFSIETPTATVIDLGTEFGVHVSPEGTAEAHVFNGEIEVAVPSTTGAVASLKERFLAGEAVRIEPVTAGQAPRLDRTIASSDEFVQYFPSAVNQPAPEAKAATNRLIATVDRRGGYTGNRVPVGPFDGETDPLGSADSGLQLGAPLFSDRVYVIDDMSRELAGADYVRTFLSDKTDSETDYAYEVTLTPERDKVFLLVLVDDRFNRKNTNQKAAVDRIVSAFARPGEFIDTGFDVEATDARKPHPLSAFGKWMPTKDASGKPIKYRFLAPPKGESTFVIAAMTEDPTTPNKHSSPGKKSEGKK